MSIDIDVPGGVCLRLEALVLDVNGTLALDGVPLPGVRERLDRIKETLPVHLVTADTHGRQAEVDAALGLAALILDPIQPQAPAKAQFVRDLGAGGVVAIGNGTNDALMLREAALGVAVVGPEGLSSAALSAADIVAPDIQTALDLLLFPKRLIATLRA